MHSVRTIDSESSSDCCGVMQTFVSESCRDLRRLRLPVIEFIESRLFRAPTRCVARVVAYLFPRQGVDLGDRAEKEPGRARTCSAKLSLCTLIAGGAAVLQELQVQASFNLGIGLRARSIEGFWATR